MLPEPPVPGVVQSVPEPEPIAITPLASAAFEIEPTWILQCAAVRQKWIDQSQSTNLWLAEADARKASFMYREAWERGLKTTYYLRTMNKSAIDSGNRERRPDKQREVAEAAALACSIEAMRNGGTCEACQ